MRRNLFTFSFPPGHLLIEPDKHLPIVLGWYKRRQPVFLNVPLLVSVVSPACSALDCMNMMLSSVSEVKEIDEFD